MKTKPTKETRDVSKRRAHESRVKAGQKSQKQGTQFEALFGEFIGRLAQRFGLLPAENRRQKAGIQFGRDWHFWWRTSDGKETRWFFQCKDYRGKDWRESRGRIVRTGIAQPNRHYLLPEKLKGKIPWQELAADLERVEKGPYEIDYWVLISPLGELADEARQEIEAAKQQNRYRFHIECWTVNENVGNLFSLDPQTYKRIYGMTPILPLRDVEEYWKQKLTQGPSPGAFNKAYYIDALIEDLEKNRTRYIPLHAQSVDKKPGEKSAREADQSESLSHGAVLDLLRIRASLLLIGNSGSGKTFALGEYALNLCRSTLELPEEKRREVPLPIFVPLKPYDPERRLLRTLIAQAISRYQQVELSEGNAVRLLHTYPSTLFFDGFNEVPSADQEQLENDLRTFRRQFSKAQVILTSQIGVLPNKLSDFPIYAVEPLFYRQVEEEIQKHYGQKAREICRRLGEEKFKKLRAMLTNPFNLSAFLNRVQRNQELPVTVREIYDALLEKRIEIGMLRRRGFDRVLTDCILTRAGLEMTKRGRVGMVEGELLGPLREVIGNELVQGRANPHRPPQDAIDDVVSTGILEIRDGYASFFHEEIQHHYSGPALIADQPLAEILKNRKHDHALIHGILSLTGQEFWSKLELVAECDPELSRKVLCLVTLDEATRARLRELALQWLGKSTAPNGLKARWVELLQVLYPGENIQRRYTHDSSGNPIDWQHLLNRQHPFKGILLREELDRLVDEIDDVLEENADEFVRSFRFPGPPPWKARPEPRLKPLDRIKPDQVTDPSLRELVTFGMQILKVPSEHQPFLEDFERFLAKYKSIPEPDLRLLSVGVRVEVEYWRQLLFPGARDYYPVGGDRKNLTYRLHLFPCAEAVALLSELLKDEEGDPAYIAGERLRVMGTPSAIEALLKGLDDSNPMVRMVVADTLSRVPVLRVSNRLCRILRVETSPEVIRSLLQSLSLQDPDRASAIVLDRLRDPKENRKAVLLDAVLHAHLVKEQIRPILMESFKHHDLTEQSLTYLYNHPDPGMLNILLPFLEDPRPEVVCATLQAISQWGEPNLASHILPILNHPSSAIRRAALFAIHSLVTQSPDRTYCRNLILESGGPTLRSQILRLMENQDECQDAIYAAGALGLAEASEHLIAILITSRDWLLVGNAAEALVRLPAGDAAPLLQLLSHGDSSGDDVDSSMQIDVGPRRITEALRVLGAWRCNGAVALIKQLLQNGSTHLVKEICLAATQCLSKIATVDASETLVHLFRTLARPCKRHTAEALVDCGDQLAIDALVPLLGDPILRDDAYDVIVAIERRLRIRTLVHLKFGSGEGRSDTQA